jgi:putative membrane protein
MPDLKRYQGLALIGVMSASTLWLAATGQLELYVAPKHAIFAVVMSSLGLAAVLVSAMRVTVHHHAEARPRMLGRVAAGVGGTVAAVVTAAMVLLPPATLTSATAAQRDVNSTAPLTDTTTLDEQSAPDASTANLSLLDWASLLRQTSDLGFYEGKTVQATGFITPDSDDPGNVFYVSRFYISHCAIDAQAVGVPVYLPNWQNTYAADDWIQLEGEFVVNPSSISTQGITVTADSIDGVNQPEDPYIYK